MESAGKKKTLVAVVAVAALLALAVGSTMAYLQDTSEPVTNNFQKNTVTVALAETTGTAYNIIPGTTETKDPRVTVTATLPSYAFVQVDDKTQNLVDWTVASGWTKLTGYTDVYYRAIDNVGDIPSAGYPVIKDDIVTYKSTLTNDDMNAASNPVSLSFTSYVIQQAKSGANGTITNFTPASAWLQVSQGITADSATRVPATDDSTANGAALEAAITTAMNGANAGDTVAVSLASGTYKGFANFNSIETGKSLEIVGDSAETTILDFSSLGSTAYVLAYDTSISNATIVLSGGCDVTFFDLLMLSDCVIDLQDNGEIYVVESGYDSENGVREVIFQRCVMRDDGEGASFRYCDATDEACFVTFEDCTFMGDVVIESCTRAAIFANCKFLAGNADGRMRLDLASETSIESCSFDESDFVGIVADGLAGDEEGYTVDISDCKVLDNDMEYDFTGKLYIDNWTDGDPQPVRFRVNGTAITSLAWPA